METKWHLSKKSLIILPAITILIVIYFAFFNEKVLEEDKTISPKLLYYSYIRNKRDSTRRTEKEFSNRRLKESMKEEKGTECVMPKMDPFDRQITQFDKVRPKVVCHGTDWVRCNFSECRVREIILNKYKNVVCEYEDLIYDTDRKSHFGNKVSLYGDEVYELKNSDHVRVSCFENIDQRNQAEKWSGLLIGYRKNVKLTPPSRPDREKTLNILLFAFDSTSKNGFFRRMPRSYKVLQEELGAVILNGYNIVGDGTTAAIFPILTGRNELELPDIRKQFTPRSNDKLPWIFYKLRNDGYRTAYFEDMPWIGTFQLRCNGWNKQPTHHYARHFFVQESKHSKKSQYCVGDTPSYALMMNITKDFFKLKGKKFCFTFVSDITHDDFNMIETADGDMADFLRTFKQDGRLEDTFLIVMGDHGPRYANVRSTYLGQLEERHPLMAIVLPEKLQNKRPESLKALKSNVDVLTTPYDIYSTILDVLRMRNKWNKYKVPGARIRRGLSLLHPVPRSRSCSEAGVEPHWCTCLRRKEIPRSVAMFRKAAEALVDYINFLIKDNTVSCMHRYLISVSYVMRHLPNSRLQQFKIIREHYSVKVVVGPGNGVYEATLTYLIDKDEFVINSRDIQRINAYGDEPSCISERSPHLNKFCYCRGYYNRHDEKRGIYIYKNKWLDALASKEGREENLNNNTRRVDNPNNKKGRVDSLTRKKSHLNSQLYGHTNKKRRGDILTGK